MQIWLKSISKENKRVPALSYFDKTMDKMKRNKERATFAVFVHDLLTPLFTPNLFCHKLDVIYTKREQSLSLFFSLSLSLSLYHSIKVYTQLNSLFVDILTLKDIEDLQQ